MLSRDIGVCHSPFPQAGILYEWRENGIRLIRRLLKLLFRILISILAGFPVLIREHRHVSIQIYNNNPANPKHGEPGAKQRQTNLVREPIRQWQGREILLLGHIEYLKISLQIGNQSASNFDSVNSQACSPITEVAYNLKPQIATDLIANN